MDSASYGSLENSVLDIKIKSVVFYLAILTFKLLLDLAYVKIIFPQYEYMGFVFVDNGMKVFSGLILFFLMMFFIPTKLDKPSNILSICLIIITYIPALTIFSYGDATYGFMFMNTVFWIILLLIIKFLPTISLPKPNSKACKIIFLLIVSLICLYCCYFVIRTFGVNFNFDILDVYNQREKYKEANIPFSAYLFTWSSNVILPMGFMYLIVKKKYLLSIIPIISQLLLFSATGMKSMLFTIPIVLIFAIFLKLKDVSLYLMITLVLASVFCIVAYSFFDEILPISLLLRRVFLVPARISQYYFDFFIEAGQIQLSHSIFSGISNYRFEAEPAQFISKIFVGSTSNFNSGIVADGFSNFGFIGVFCWSIFTAFVLKLLDAVSKDKNKAIVIAGIIMFISSLSNSALITNLGTHGVTIAIFMIYILPPEQKKGANI
ncbi:MAG: O-antigen polymerase [Oscillospiraceae bacterium]